MVWKMYTNNPSIESLGSEVLETNTSQFNPNNSVSNLLKINNWKSGDGKTGGVLPMSRGLASFLLPITPPFSNRGSPMVEKEDPVLASSENVQTKHKWLPPINFKIVFLCTNWYIFSLISSNSTKMILRLFLYPITLTQCQFIMNMFFCIVFLSILLRLYHGSTGAEKLQAIFPRGTIPDLSKISSLKAFLLPTPLILSSTLPMGVFQFTGHITSHKATSIIPVSMVHTIKALSPLSTVLINRIVLGKRYRSITYLTLLPLSFGVMLSCYNPVHFNNVQLHYTSGLMYAFISMLIFVVQNISSKKTLTVTEKDAPLPLSNNKRGNNKIDKVTILFYCSVIGFLFTFPIYVYSEFVNTKFSLKEITPAVALLIFLNGFSHFIQSLLAFQLLGAMSPISYSVASIFKRIIIILVSFIIEKQFKSYNQCYGLLLTLLGLYCYDRWGAAK